jgi:predicted ATPase
MTALELGLESTGLVERAAERAALAELMTAAGTGEGRVALVYGEAGVGKTALVRQCCDDAPDAASVLWGACDALFTPRPLGPLLDIALEVGGELADALAGGPTPY